VTDQSERPDPLKEPDQPSWQGKTMGEAVAEDLDQADRLLEQTGGDVEEAEQRFDSGIDDVGETPVRPQNEPDTQNAG
jgi:hypothetical protein